MLHVRKFGWTKDVLIHQIENKTYEKYLMNQTNFDQTLPEKYKHQAKLAVKDHYTFDFLELAEEHSEHELEQTLVKNIRKFLIEMGVWFTFWRGNLQHLALHAGRIQQISACAGSDCGTTGYC